MITIPEQDLIKLLEVAFDSGWNERKQYEEQKWEELFPGDVPSKDDRREESMNSFKFLLNKEHGINL